MLAYRILIAHLFLSLPQVQQQRRCRRWFWLAWLGAMGLTAVWVGSISIVGTGAIDALFFLRLIFIVALMSFVLSALGVELRLDANFVAAMVGGTHPVMHEVLRIKNLEQESSNRKLGEQALCDGLTQVYSRSYVEGELRRLVQGLQRKPGDFSVQLLTSILLRASTTRRGRRWVTKYCAASPRWCSKRYAAATSGAVGAGRNSSCSCPTPHCPRRWKRPSVCAC